MHSVCLVGLLLGLLALSGKSEITGLVGELLGGEVESGASSQTHGEEQRVNLDGDGGALLGLVLQVSKKHISTVGAKSSCHNCVHILCSIMSLSHSGE